MRNKLLLFVGSVSLLWILILMVYVYIKNGNRINKHIQKVVEITNNENREVFKPIPAKKVEEVVNKQLEDVDLSTTFVYGDTAFGYAKVLEYAYDTKPVNKPMYKASEDVIKHGVLVISGLKPNTKYYLKIWINGNLYVDTTFTTKDKNYKRRLELLKKIEKIKQGWSKLTYDSSKEYIYKNYLLAFANKVEYRLISSGGEVFGWRLYTGQSLKSGYIYLKGLRSGTNYTLEVLLNGKKRLVDHFSTTNDNLKENNLTLVDNDELKVENETGLVVKDGKLILHFIYSGDVKQIKKIVLKPVVGIEKIKDIEKKYYTEKEFKECTELVKKIYKKIYKVDIPDDVLLFPYINSGDARFLTGELKKYKSLFDKCYHISLTVDKVRQKYIERINRELEKEAKVFRVGGLPNSYVVEGFTGKDYELRIYYITKDDKEKEKILYVAGE